MPEPRKIFLGLLINRLADVEARIYLSGQATELRRSIDAIKGIIDILDKHSKDALKKQYDRLCAMSHGGDSEDGEVESIFREVTDYLHKTYLQEVNMGIVPASSLPSTEKLPEHTPIERRVSPRL